MNPDEFVVEDGWLDIEGVELRDCTLDCLDADQVEIVGSKLVGVQLLTGPSTVVIVRDSLLERCDLSRMQPESVLRSRFQGCKLSGAVFAGSVIDNQFANCSIRMASFSTADVTRTSFEDSELVEVDMLDATLTDVTFDGCTITELNLDRVTCERVDFRETTTLEIKVGQNLAGCLVTPAQTQELALWLAHQVGFSIESV